MLLMEEELEDTYELLSQDFVLYQKVPLGKQENVFKNVHNIPLEEHQKGK